jgi:hypothetical protein
VVLTIPGEVRDVLRDRDANATIRRRAVDVVKAWAIRWGFHGVPVRLGGSVVAHPCGENPDIWAPHFNVIFPWVGETDDGSYRIGRYHLDPRALDDLRLRWAMELVDLGWTPTCSPQVDYEFRKTERAKRHAARYFFRSFPAWQAWTHRVFWWGILAHSVEAHDPPTWSTPTKLGRCPDCNGYTRSVESVRRGHWSARAADGSWHRLEGVPPGKWGNVFLGSS